MLKNILFPAIFTFSLLIGYVHAGDSHGHDHGTSHIVNINTASAAVMDEKLQFVGRTTARRIVEYRETNGDFKSLEELDAVKGIGPQIINANREIMKL